MVNVGIIETLAVLHNTLLWYWYEKLNSGETTFHNSTSLHRTFYSSPSFPTAKLPERISHTQYFHLYKITWNQCIGHFRTTEILPKYKSRTLFYSMLYIPRAKSLITSPPNQPLRTPYSCTYRAFTLCTTWATHQVAKKNKTLTNPNIKAPDYISKASN